MHRTPFWRRSGDVHLLPRPIPLFVQTKRHKRFAKLVGSSGTLTWGTGSGRVRSVDEPYPERMGAGVRTLARQQKLQGHEALCCFQVELDGKVIARERPSSPPRLPHLAHAPDVPRVTRIPRVSRFR